ncbi:hypothetical protein GGS24DRAFT_459823 [Hypoxylon argillaceum]|nr:hypothetical protein GGS24DRAFT_459823 [Hypoxylon argillaceum]
MPARATQSRYNKKTAPLFSLMGGKVGAEMQPAFSSAIFDSASFLQYAAKVDFDTESNTGLHSMLSRTTGTWDSVVYRTYTADMFPAAVVGARISSSGPWSSTWIMDSGICNAISMDLAKSAWQIYQQDDH